VSTKTFKTNARGEAQFGIHYPLKIVEKLWRMYQSNIKSIEKAGEIKATFKDWFYNEFLKLKLDTYKK